MATPRIIAEAKPISTPRSAEETEAIVYCKSCGDAVEAKLLRLYSNHALYTCRGRRHRVRILHSLGRNLAEKNALRVAERDARRFGWHPG